MNARRFQRVAVIGGAGYVGSALVPKLLQKGYEVLVYDLFIYGENIFDELKSQPGFKQIKGDIRNFDLVRQSLPGCDSLIHLACISNDPSFELNPDLGKSINYDAFGPMVEISQQVGIKRFIYASSSSVYGIKNTPNVTEDLPPEPLTDYSKYKALCEHILNQRRKKGFETIILRPATVCGYAPRLRLDLSVNILTNHAYNNRKIKVLGGEQMRPNIHIDDVADLYVQCLEWPSEKIDGQTFNAGFENQKIIDLAHMVKAEVGKDVQLVVEDSPDSRSYHISSEKIRRELGFTTRKTIRDAVRDLMLAFQTGKIPDPMTSSRYYNIKRMQEISLV